VTRKSETELYEQALPAAISIEAGRALRRQVAKTEKVRRRLLKAIVEAGQLEATGQLPKLIVSSLAQALVEADQALREIHAAVDMLLQSQTWRRVQTLEKILREYRRVRRHVRQALDKAARWPKSQIMTLSRNCSILHTPSIVSTANYFVQFTQASRQELPPAISDSEPGSFKFLPHDGGLFSNFNFMVGEMCLGRRIYPLFSMKEALRRNGSLKHFAYVSPNCDNSWFEFFKPIEYYPGDQLHANRERLSLLDETFGQLANTEFRTPGARMALFNSEEFSSWREKVHNVISGKIEVSDEVAQRVGRMLDCMPHYRIGVHVRHPSHLVEQGNIHFSNYFSAVDKSLQDHPEAGLFLATDNELAIAAFKMRYADKLFYYPEFIRQSIDEVMNWAYALVGGTGDSMGFVDGVGFQTHYRLAASGGGAAGVRHGKETVTDVYALAACDELVCTLSNVTLTCSFLNPQQTLHLVSKGLC
jgi:hypothetical protein